MERSMKRRTDIAGLIVTALAWSVVAIAVPLGGSQESGISAQWQAWLISACGFAAVALLPGWAIERCSRSRAAGRHDSAAESSSPFERPARAFALSVASAGLIGVAISAAGLADGIFYLAAGQLFVTVTCLLASTFRNGTGDRRRDRHPRATAEAIAFGALATLMALMALGAANIARDRMWYLAYITDLAAGGPIDWAEPLLGTGRVVARFAYNATLLIFGSWQNLTALDPLQLFEVHAPVVLAVLTVSAAIAPSRSLFGRGTGAAIGATMSVWILLSTRFPFFAPDRYPLFGRLPEDKTIALLVLVPVALAAVLDTLRPREANARRPAPLVVFLLLCAVAASHAIVYLLLLVTIAAVVIAAATATIPPGRTRPPLGDFIRTALIAALVAAGPATIGIAARGQIIETPATAAAFEDTELSRHPVVRSHDRMQRLRGLEAGGPIVEPGLVSEPLLMVGLLAGVLLALARRHAFHGAFLAGTTLGFLALAFLPWISPAFGRLVVPWMAYRALWGVPFGLLLAMPALEAATLAAAPGKPRRHAVALVALVLIGVSAQNAPWSRLDWLGGKDDPPAPGVGIDTDSRVILERIAELGPRARVAAASGFAELIPALAGHPVLAFSDRGTVVFSGSLHDAERRLRGGAALVAIGHGSRRMRNRIVSAYDVTHVVTDGRGCDRRSALIAAAGSLRLCAERLRASPKRFLPPIRAAATAGHRAGGDVIAIAAIDKETTPSPGVSHFTCKPAPERLEAEGKGAAVWRWKRAKRWTAKALTVDCVARTERDVRGGLLRIGLALPRAREALIFRVTAAGPGGKRTRRHGALEFRENPVGEIRLPDIETDRLRVRLAPAYLPYLNLKTLSWLPSPSGDAAAR